MGFNPKKPIKDIAQVSYDKAKKRLCDAVGLVVLVNTKLGQYYGVLDSFNDKYVVIDDKFTHKFYFFMFNDNLESIVLELEDSTAKKRLCDDVGLVVLDIRQNQQKIRQEGL